MTTTTTTTTSTTTTTTTTTTTALHLFRRSDQHQDVGGEEPGQVGFVGVETLRDERPVQRPRSDYDRQHERQRKPQIERRHILEVSASMKMLLHAHTYHICKVCKRTPVVARTCTHTHARARFGHARWNTEPHTSHAFALNPGARQLLFGQPHYGPEQIKTPKVAI